VQSIWGVLLAPEKTFRALAARPHWLPALLLLVAVALALSLVVTPKLDMKQVVRDAIEESGRDISAAQLEQQLAIAEKFKWVGTASQFVLQPAVYIIMAGALPRPACASGQRHRLPAQPLGVGARHDAVPAGDAAHHPGGSVARHALPRGRPERRATSTRTWRPSRPRAPPSRCWSLLSSVDLFSIWTIALLAIGYRVVGKVSNAVALRRRSRPLGGRRRRKDRPCRDLLRRRRVIERRGRGGRGGRGRSCLGSHGGVA
jgi:hypothetical protein